MKKQVKIQAKKTTWLKRRNSFNDHRLTRRTKFDEFYSDHKPKVDNNTGTLKPKRSSSQEGKVLK